MSSSDELSEDRETGEKHTECWVDLNGEIRECCLEEMSLERALAGSQGESRVCLSESRMVPR